MHTKKIQGRSLLGFGVDRLNSSYYIQFRIEEMQCKILNFEVLFIILELLKHCRFNNILAFEKNSFLHSLIYYVLLHPYSKNSKILLCKHKSIFCPKFEFLRTNLVGFVD